MPEKAKLRLERVNLGSERAEFSPENAVLQYSYIISSSPSIYHLLAPIIVKDVQFGDLYHICSEYITGVISHLINRTPVMLNIFKRNICCQSSILI